MHDIIVKNRWSFLESFIIFSVIAIGLLIYLHFNPYSYPGLSEKIYWMFAIYLILLTAFYFFEITDYLIDTISAFIDLADRTGMPFVDHLTELPLALKKDRGEYEAAELMRIGINSIFQFVLVAYLLTLLVQELHPPAKEWLNMNYFLLTVILFGAASVLANKDDEKNTVHEPVELTTKDYIFIGFAGITGAVIIWYKTEDIGRLSYLIAALSGILIILLSILVMEDDEEITTNNITSEEV